MASTRITDVCSRDVRFDLEPAAGTDAIHTSSQYAFAVTELASDGAHTGSGLTLTLGAGNDLVCQAIQEITQPLIGMEIEEMMAGFGTMFRRLADHNQLRWLGPHKGVIHLALASVTNACFDLWAKSRGVPLWRLLLDLSPHEVVALLDLSYLEEVLPAQTALDLLAREAPGRAKREAVLDRGYPGYDTSIGWFGYDDARLRENAKRAADDGFTAVKLKVGSPAISDDVRRAELLREVLGPDVRIMLDVNQQWSLPKAIDACDRLAPMTPFWIEEPIHPDDILGHQSLAREIDPLPIAIGEHVPNRVGFKNYLQAGAVDIVQVDCTRVGGVSEFLTVSLLARLFGVPVVPHVGDMGQIHQHLVLFNHIALGHEKLFLEYIPHLRRHFCDPAIVRDGVYRTPEEPGSSSDLKQESA